MADFLSSLGSALGAAATASPIGAISAGVGAVGSIANSLMSNSSSRKAMRQQTEMMRRQASLQQDMMKYQNDLNISNWNLQNAYNTPAAQMQRYKDAGLNTNLIYGGSGAVAGNAESASGVSGHSPDMPSAAATPEMLKRQMDIANFAALRQVALTDSQVDLNNALSTKALAEADQVAPNAAADRSLKASQEDLLKKQANQTERFTDFFNETFELRKEALSITNSLNKEQANYFKAQTAAAMYNLENIMPITKAQQEFYLNYIMPATLDEIQSRLHLNRAQACQYFANALYLGSLKAGQDLYNDYNGKLYGNNLYIGAVVNKTIQEGNKLMNESNYWRARTNSENNGYPYLHVMPYSGSLNGSVGAFGFGAGVGGSLSGSYIFNPVQ